LLQLITNSVKTISDTKSQSIYFFFLDLLNTPPMERMNKATLFAENTTQSEAQVWRFSVKPEGLGVDVSFLE